MTNIDDIVVQCCVCDLYVIKDTEETGRVWGVIPQDELKGKEISHTYCPPCAYNERVKYKLSISMKK